MGKLRHRKMHSLMVGCKEQNMAGDGQYSLLQPWLWMPHFVGRQGISWLEAWGRIQTPICYQGGIL